MSRSFKKTPIVGFCSDSDKEDKRKANRKLRRKTKESIHTEQEVLPTQKGTSDVWDMNKDGKCYVGGKVRK